MFLKNIVYFIMGIKVERNYLFSNELSEFTAEVNKADCKDKLAYYPSFKD